VLLQVTFQEVGQHFNICCGAAYIPFSTPIDGNIPRNAKLTEICYKHQFAA